MSNKLSITSVLNIIKVTLGLLKPEYKSVPQKKVKQKKTAPLPLSVEEARQIVSGLIFEVLRRETCVREAIKRFPVDQFDPSIQTAFHSLVYFAADEEMRLRDPVYAAEQDNYIEMIAFTLQKGQALPLNIIQSYKTHHDMALIPRSKTLKAILKSLMRFMT